MKQLSDHLQSFLEEATELIESLEKTLLILEEDKSEKKAIHDFFRAMHTLKGSSRMFGYIHLSDFAHKFESLYDLIRNEELELNQSVLDLSFESLDHFKILLHDAQLSKKQNKKQHNEKIERINQLLEVQHQKNNSASEKLTAELNEDSTVTTTYHIHIKPLPGAFEAQIQFLPSIESLNDKGTVFVIPNIGELPEFDDFYTYDTELISWDIVYSGWLDEEKLSQEFLLIQSFCEIEFIELSKNDIFQNEHIINFLKAKKELSNGLQAFELMEMLEKTPSENNQKTIEKTEVPNQANQNSNSFSTDSVHSIRVNVNKLDTLLSLVSELVTAQARLNVFVDANSQNGLQEVAEDIEKITRRLRENAFAISMIPISTLETRFHRVIRDIAAAENKKVQLVCNRLETELEKTLIEIVTPPLLHILRNSVDHGIESPEERIKAGKSEIGLIEISANYSGANVIIEIRDDGKGINLEVIRKKGIEKNLIKPEHQYSERELLDLLFKPGFSTAKQVTEVSGRGVGMDVVKTAMNQMRGEVLIETKAGKGTKITLRLPLNLSILDGLLIKVLDQKFIIPLQIMDKCYEIPHFSRKQKNDDIAIIEGEQIPYIDMRDIIDNYENRPLIDSLIVVKYNDLKVGILADQIIGEHQAVVKSLGTLFRKVQAVSGATILGDGEIALILDVNKVISEYVLTSNLKQEVNL